jgi:hypothetical protein
MEISDNEIIEALVEYEQDRELVDLLTEFEDDRALNEFMARYEQEPQTGGASLYRVVRTDERYNARFDIIDRTIEVIWSSVATSFANANEQVEGLFQQIYDDHIAHLSSNVMVRMIVDHDLLESPCSTHLIEKDQFTPELIASTFTNTIQSRKSTLGEAMTPRYKMKINLAICTVIRGGHRGRSQRVAENREHIENIIDLDTFCRASKFITVLKKDRKCLVQAVVIAKALCDGEANAHKLKKYPKILAEKVARIYRDCRLPENEDLGIPHIQRIETYLEQYNIVCYSGGNRMSDPVYFNKHNLKKNFLYLLHDNDHYCVIHKITSWFSANYFCDYHQAVYTTIGKHKCEYMCSVCYRTNCEKTKTLPCACKRAVANNDECLRKHKELMCIKSKICETCNRLVINKKHVCLNEKWCSNCKKAVDVEHKCFILTGAQVKQRDKNLPKIKNAGFVAFDFETRVDDETNEHVVNLAISQRICNSCVDEPRRCQNCEGMVMHENIKDYVDWMLSTVNKNFIFIAHNAKSFDSYPLIKEFQKRLIPTDSEMSVVTDGNKLMQIKFRDICIKDSSLFIPLKLEAFPEALNLTELKKGFWCHTYNKPENYEHDRLGYPDEHYYQPEFMSVKKQAEFKEWYAKVKDTHFCFRDELINYCKYVNLKCCLRYNL